MYKCRRQKTGCGAWNPWFVPDRIFFQFFFFVIRNRFKFILWLIAFVEHLCDYIIVMSWKSIELMVYFGMKLQDCWVTVQNGENTETRRESKRAREKWTYAHIHRNKKQFEQDGWLVLWKDHEIFRNVNYTIRFIRRNLVQIKFSAKKKKKKRINNSNIQKKRQTPKKWNKNSIDACVYADRISSTTGIFVSDLFGYCISFHISDSM